MSQDAQKLLKLALGVGMVAVALKLVQARRQRYSFEGQVVLITGGSRGLGLELARCWAEEGAKVIVCARTASDIAHVVDELRGQGFDVHGIICDVTAKERVDDLIKAVLKRWGTLDVLVNNAGIMEVGPVECMKLKDFERTLDTHFWGPLNTIRAVLPHMRRRGRGRIVNIASVGGEISVPHLVPYSASKFALVGLSEGLCAELAAVGIHVTTVCPGLMRTGSPRNAHFKGQHRKEYAWFSIAAAMPGITMSSRHAAKKIIRACRDRRPYLALSLPAKAAIRIHALCPSLFARMMRLVNHFLPSRDGADDSRRRGDESFSVWSPSPLTWLNESAAIRNNEVREPSKMS